VALFYQLLEFLDKNVPKTNCGTENRSGGSVVNLSVVTDLRNILDELGK
jgi:hypothetical protein